MFGIIAGQPDIIHPKLTPAQRRRHLEIARAQQAPFRRRGRIPTDRYYQDIIDAARQRGSYRRPTYGETYGQRIVDRLNGRRSSGSGNFGFRRGGPQTTGHRNDGRGPTVFQPQRRWAGHPGWRGPTVTPGEIPGKDISGQGGWGHWGRDMDPIPTRGRRVTSRRDPRVLGDESGWRKRRKRRRGKSASKATSGKKGVHRTRDKSLPIWQRYGAKSEAEWKGMSRKERGREKARQDWERRKAFLRANPNKFRGGISMQANWRNGKLTGAFAGNKLNKKDRLEQWIRHKDQQYKRKWRK